MRRAPLNNRFGSVWSKYRRKFASKKEDHNSFEKSCNLNFIEALKRHSSEETFYSSVLSHWNFQRSSVHVVFFWQNGPKHNILQHLVFLLWTLIAAYPTVLFVHYYRKENFSLIKRKSLLEKYCAIYQCISTILHKTNPISSSRISDLFIHSQFVLENFWLSPQKLPCFRMMHHCLTTRTLQNQPRILIEHQSHSTLLPISSYWAAVLIHVEMTSSKLVFSVPSPDAGVSQACLLKICTKLLLNICVSMAFNSPKYPLSFL